MRSTKNAAAFLFGLFATATAVAGCARPHEQVNPTGAERLSRNVSPARLPDAPRDMQAAAVAPPVRPANPEPDTLGDAFIGAKIRAALLADPGMSGADVSVNVEHGVVVLAGMVKSYEQSGIASAYAQRQDGVMRVDNQLALSLQ
jgi:hypothetical protein